MGMDTTKKNIFNIFKKRQKLPSKIRRDVDSTV
jgi:hypothetical protein